MDARVLAISELPILLFQDVLEKDPPGATHHSLSLYSSAWSAICLLSLIMFVLSAAMPRFRSVHCSPLKGQYSTGHTYTMALSIS